MQVFYTRVCTPLFIYIDPTERMTQFQELIAEQVDIGVQDQELLLENHALRNLLKL